MKIAIGKNYRTEKKYLMIWNDNDVNPMNALYIPINWFTKIWYFQIFVRLNKYPRREQRYVYTAYDPKAIKQQNNLIKHWPFGHNTPDRPIDAAIKKELYGK